MVTDRTLRAYLFARVVGAFLIVLGALALSGMAALAQDGIPSEPQPVLDTLTSWQFIVSVLLIPAVIAFTSKESTPSWMRSASMVGLAIVAVVGGMFFRNELVYASGNDLIALIMTAIVAITGFYNGVLKPMGVRPATFGRTD